MLVLLRASLKPQTDLVQFSSRPLATPRAYSKRPQLNYAHSALLSQQSRSISWTGWWSSKPSAPENPPSNQAVIDPASSQISDLKDPVKASLATADTPDPSYLHGVPADQAKPELLERVEDAVLGPTDGAADLADISQIPERIGYLTEVCGLQYWYGFTSSVQWVMEHIHVWGGVPWSVTIIATAVLIKLSFFNFNLMANRSGTKMREIQPYLQPLKEDYKAAAMRGDRQEAMRLGKQVRALSRESGIKAWHGFLPLIQIPFTFGGFRTLRNAADLPVPSMEAESFLWLDSLAVSDPYILPAIIGIMTYRGLNKQIANMGANNPGAGMMVIFKYILPVVSVLFCHYQLLAVQIWFLSQTLLTQLQLTLLNNDTFRSRFGLGPSPANIPPPQPTDAFGYQTKSDVGGMRLRNKTIDVSIKPKQEAAPETAQNVSYIDKAVGKFKSSFQSYTKDGRELASSTRQSQEDKGKQKSLDAYEQQEQERQELERQARNPKPHSSQIAGMRLKTRKS
ncbi:uncharacterized protein HMPREF1541_10389 [Cyphellophora europaea CBS 101466]|uniref:Membrane insertase YidC/Oxa/ALB C-terminal domain-containing protein n=1 Tax=Cyphellophora europaea (strain CBS 101466) TaxID=1220924 RepID=W2S9X3_CYPE1|nr:uncharacterized protein HMPREF1541_10389 [Cyphellophora europaea CBS 101466]ETN44719.1 hypothetical protein HMPREF1541_10389 [Cyphellophora europaea CBS 101466]